MRSPRSSSVIGRCATAVVLAACAMLALASHALLTSFGLAPRGLTAQVVQAAAAVPDLAPKAPGWRGDDPRNLMVANTPAAVTTERSGSDKESFLHADRRPWQQLTPNAVVPGEPTVLTGSIAGVKYEIQVPAQWNGTLLLYSHGLRDASETDNAAEVFADPGVGIWLLSNGYALAGSGFRSTGWIIETAMQDQIALLDLFEQRFGRPRRTIAWGYSMGAVVTAGLVQAHPGRFDGALPICGGMGGALGFWNAGLDTMYVLKTLVAPGDPINLVRITDAAASYKGAQQLILRAQGTAQGQARLALAAAVGGLPGWFGPADLTEPGATEVSVQEWHQFFWLYYYTGYMQTVTRRELEQRAGGNPSWNTGSITVSFWTVLPGHNRCARCISRPG